MKLEENATVVALIETLFPAGDQFPAADATALARQASQYIVSIPGASASIQAMLAVLDTRYRLRHGHRFAGAPLRLRERFLSQYTHSRLTHRLLHFLSLPFRAAYLLDTQNLSRAGTHNGLQAPKDVEAARWQQQVSTVDDMALSQTFDVDAVVVGTGAGGGAAAYELASRGLAVLIIEEGEYHSRKDFTGKLTELVPKLYRGMGATMTWGNTVIPVPVGRSVGGTTTINSGTCMRTPEGVLAEWVAEGLSSFTPDVMAPYFDSVETMINVERAEVKFVGEIAEVVKQGAEALGFTQMHPLMRNAKGCDGQGLCQFGCPTDAKQSTNVSYIPRALDAGGFLITGMKVDRFQYADDGGSIRGVHASGVASDGVTRHLTVNTDTVVIAAGAFGTPQLLANNGIKNRWLGRNLSIHPAGAVLGHYPNRDFKNTATIPQGYGIADWAEQGIMFEGGTPPFVAHGLMSPLIGRDFVEFAENYQHTAYFGFMIKDSSRGRVRKGLHPDVPWLTYSMNRSDFTLFTQAAYQLARIHLEAGAERVTLGSITGLPAITNLETLDKVFAGKLTPRDFAITAYHPLGTARIAKDRKHGVCDENHQVFGVRGLYVMDGSAVPSALGANPQVTIMAMATKAARRIADTKIAYV